MDAKFLIEKINKLLPGYNCGACGCSRCDIYTQKLIMNKANIDSCKHLLQAKFEVNKKEIVKLLNDNSEVEVQDNNKIYGVIDKYEADFILKPLINECSCREILYPFVNREFTVGEIIRYRPLGCPITHFAEVLNVNDGLITVHMIGPRHRLGDNQFKYVDVGVCMVGGFEGTIEGELPNVGDTVRFLPHHCMMQKVHSGVVVELIDNRVLIEGIDLKVWAPPIKKS